MTRAAKCIVQPWTIFVKGNIVIRDFRILLDQQKQIQNPDPTKYNYLDKTIVNRPDIENPPIIRAVIDSETGLPQMEYDVQPVVENELTSTFQTEPVFDPNTGEPIIDTSTGEPYQKPVVEVVENPTTHVPVFQPKITVETQEPTPDPYRWLISDHVPIIADIILY